MFEKLKAQRAELMAAANQMIEDGDIDGANAKMDEIKALDDKINALLVAKKMLMPFPMLRLLLISAARAPFLWEHQPRAVLTWVLWALTTARRTTQPKESMKMPGQNGLSSPKLCPSRTWLL